MSTTLIIKSIIELTIILLVGYAILKEDKFIAFEQKLFNKIRDRAKKTEEHHE